MFFGRQGKLAMTQHFRLQFVFGIALGAAMGSLAYADDPPATSKETPAEATKAAADAVKHDAKVVGTAVKEGAQKVGVAAKEVAGEVADAAQQGAHEVAAAAKTGAAKTKAAVTGDKKTDTAEPASAPPP
jgi:gas vesicle protein